MVILTYYYFNNESENNFKYIVESLSRLELFRLEQDIKYIYYVHAHNTVNFQIKNYCKITYDIDSKQFKILQHYLKKQEDQEKQISLDLVIDKSNIPEFIEFNLSKFQGSGWDSKNYFILETKLQEYETKYTKLFDKLKNNILSEFEQIKQTNKLFRYIIVKDIDGEIYDLEEKFSKSDSKLSESNDLDKQTEQFNLVHKLIQKYNYCSALVQLESIEFDSSNYKIKTTVSKCFNVLDRTIETKWGRENPDSKYTESGRLTLGQELLFVFNPLYSFDGFENISTKGCTVYHRICDDGDDAMIFFMDEEQYQKKLIDWVNKYFHGE